MISILDNGHIHTLLPHKELPGRHNQTRAHPEAQRYKYANNRCA